MKFFLSWCSRLCVHVCWGFGFFGWEKNVAVFVLLPGVSHKLKDVTQGQCR